MSWSLVQRAQSFYAGTVIIRKAAQLPSQCSLFPSLTASSGWLLTQKTFRFESNFVPSTLHCYISFAETVLSHITLWLRLWGLFKVPLWHTGSEVSDWTKTRKTSSGGGGSLSVPMAQMAVQSAGRKLCGRSPTAHYMTAF